MNGEGTDPIFTWLKKAMGFQGLNKNHPYYDGMVGMFDKNVPGWEQSDDIKWNFTKFLINKRGTVVGRFETTYGIDEVQKEVAKELDK